MKSLRNIAIIILLLILFIDVNSISIKTSIIDIENVYQLVLENQLQLPNNQTITSRIELNVCKYNCSKGGFIIF